jgi:hypothetical protein
MLTHADVCIGAVDDEPMMLYAEEPMRVHMEAHPAVGGRGSRTVDRQEKQGEDKQVALYKERLRMRQRMADKSHPQSHPRASHQQVQ